MRPKYFNKLRYSSVGQALKHAEAEFSALWDAIESTDMESDSPTVYTPDIPQITPDNSTLTKYNGLFTIGVDYSRRILVTDGSVSSGLGPEMLANVNGTYYNVKPYRSSKPLPAPCNVYVILHYRGPTAENGTSRDPDVQIDEIENNGKVPLNTAYDSYYVLGEVRSTANGVLRIKQYHVTGIPVMRWSYRLGEPF